jgi:hypothetical protein
MKSILQKLTSSNTFCAIMLIGTFLTLLKITFLYGQSYLNFWLITLWISWLAIAIYLTPFIFIDNDSNSLENKTATFDQRMRVREIFGKLLGSIVVVSGFYITWLSLDNARKSSESEQNNAALTLNLNAQRQLQENYFRAIEALSSSNNNMRLGAIYSLEKIARNDPNDYYWQVIEVLLQYIRENRAIERSTDKLPTLPDQGIKSILSFFDEGHYSIEHSRSDTIDLSNTDLRSIDLSDLNLQFASFNNSNLSNTNFNGTNLYKASFIGANLSKANFDDANLIKANFKSALISDTRFMQADLYGAKFASAKFFGKNFLAEASFASVRFCGDYSPYKNDTENACTEGLSCKLIQQVKISNTRLLPNYLKQCPLKTIEDPGKKEYQEIISAVKKGNFAPLGKEQKHAVDYLPTYSPYGHIQRP